jgi:hypothetical protein
MHRYIEEINHSKVEVLGSKNYNIIPFIGFPADESS